MGWNELVGTRSGMGSTGIVNVAALEVYDDAHGLADTLGGGAALYAGGEFATAGGVTANGIAKWDGELVGTRQRRGTVACLCAGAP